MTVKKLFHNQSPRKYGTGRGSNSQPLDLQSLPANVCVSVSVGLSYTAICLKLELFVSDSALVILSFGSKSRGFNRILCKRQEVRFLNFVYILMQVRTFEVARK